MHYYLHLRLENFYVKNPATVDSPLVILRGKQVLDCNALARLRGCCPGMGSAEAKTLLHGATFIQHLNDDYGEPQEKWLSKACVYAGALESDDQHSAFIDLSPHPDPLLIAFKLTAAINKLGYEVRWGVAPTKWVSELASKYNSQQEPLYDLACFLKGISIRQLPISPEAQERLERLGFSTIGQAANLSLKDLKDQFGEEGLRIQLAMEGRLHEQLKPNFPKCSLTEHFYFKETIEDTEVLARAVQKLSQKLGTTLKAQDLSGYEAKLVFDTEEGTKVFSRTFSKPIHNPYSLRFALLLLIKDFKTGVNGFRVTLTNLTKTDKTQKSLLNHHQTLGQIELSVNNLRRTIGESSILKASDIEITRSKRQLNFWKDATGWR